MSVLEFDDDVALLERLQEIMVENGLSIRAIPKTIRSIVELRHKNEFPQGHSEYLESFKREMWVYETHPKIGGKFVVESKCGTNSMVRFTGKKFYNSLEEILKEYGAWNEGLDGRKMNISGFISEDYNGWATIKDVPFAELMYELAEQHGITHEYDDGLGGKKALIKHCRITMYTSKKKMNFEEAMKKFCDCMFGVDGAYEMEANYTGYSEWTITGFDLDKCSLGGHDMNQILLSHKGKYANIRIECL